MDFTQAVADPAVVAIARDWLRLCAEDGTWPDLTPAKADRLAPSAVIYAVDRQWGGGLQHFLTCCADEIADQRTTFGTTAPTTEPAAAPTSRMCPAPPAAREDV